MSSDDSPEAIAEESAQQAGGLGEVIPEPLMPVWKQIDRVQSFRRTHGEKYVNVLELLTGLLLAGGYVWWMLIFFGVL